MLDKTPLRKIKLMQGDESVLVVAWATTSGTTTLAKVPLFEMLDFTSHLFEMLDFTSQMQVDS
jgi:hypothetical protein